ncbi:MAG: tryptophan synthase subunit alpha [Phycisphaeraceae bacterium]
MNRIDRIFHDLRARRAKALMPFITAGDPDVATTAELLPALEQAGASVVEIGFPFSDPIADGPVIQASMTHALDRGLRVAHIFEHVAGVRDRVGLGLVAMVSYSIVHRWGVDRFARDAAAAGFDALLIPDLPVDSAGEARDATHDAGLALSMLVAPTTPDARAAEIARAASGFLYVLSRAGVTGERAELPAELPARIGRLRDATDLPIAVGFGIASGEQVRQVVRVADAAIVGSAIVRRVAEHRDADRTAIIEQVASLTRELAAGLADPAATT